MSRCRMENKTYNLCAQQHCQCSEPGMPWFIRIPDSKHHCPKCNVDDKQNIRRKPCNAKMRQAKGNKTRAENHAMQGFGMQREGKQR